MKKQTSSETVCQALAVTNKGIEDVASQEISELLDVKAVPSTESVLFSASIEQIAEVTYKAQTLESVMLVLASGTLEECLAAKLDVSTWLSGSKTFLIEVDKDDSLLSSQELGAQFGEVLEKQTGCHVDYKNASVAFLLFIRNGKAWFGVDLAGMDLSKRSYRVFLGTNSLKGSLAAALVRLSGFSQGKILLDPFCRHGIIPIEAALITSGLSPHFFCKEKLSFKDLLPTEDLFKSWDKKSDTTKQSGAFAMHDNFSFVNAARKNAQLAGVNKALEFSRQTLEWIDLKFEPKTVDCFVSFPPQVSQTHPVEKISKVWDRLFLQAKRIMKKDGKVVLIVRQAQDLMKETAKKYGFKTTHQRTIWQGGEELPVMVFERE